MSLTWKISKKNVTLFYLQLRKLSVEWIILDDLYGIDSLRHLCDADFWCRLDRYFLFTTFNFLGIFDQRSAGDWYAFFSWNHCVTIYTLSEFNGCDVCVLENPERWVEAAPQINRIVFWVGVVWNVRGLLEVGDRGGREQTDGWWVWYDFGNSCRIEKLIWYCTG